MYLRFTWHNIQKSKVSAVSKKPLTINHNDHKFETLFIGISCLAQLTKIEPQVFFLDMCDFDTHTKKSTQAQAACPVNPLMKLPARHCAPFVI